MKARKVFVSMPSTTAVRAGKPSATSSGAATAAGVKLSINTDAHGPCDLDELRYGILTARRAAVTAKDVINCMSRPVLAKWIKATRS